MGAVGSAAQDFMEVLGVAVAGPLRHYGTCSVPRSFKDRGRNMSLLVPLARRDIAESSNLEVEWLRRLLTKEWFRCPGNTAVAEVCPLGMVRTSVMEEEPVGFDVVESLDGALVVLDNHQARPRNEEDGWDDAEE